LQYVKYTGFTLQKELQNVLKNNVFLDKNSKTQQQQQQQQQNRKSNIKILARNGNQIRDRWPPQLDALPLDHRVNWEYRLLSSYLNCFNAMGQNVKKHSRICDSFFFCNILICMDNYVLQFLIFTGFGFPVLIWLKSKM